MKAAVVAFAPVLAFTLASVAAQAALEIRPERGYYTVHTLRDGKPSSKIGDKYLGKAIYFFERSYLSDDKREVVVGPAAAFSSFGKFETRKAVDGSTYFVWFDVKWENVNGEKRRKEYKGVAALGPAPDSGDARNLYLTLVNHPDFPAGSARSFLLRYHSARLPDHTRYVSHRGVGHFPPFNSWAIYPSNSMEAFEEALRQGFDGFELDVRLSKDGQWVVSHDVKLSVATDCEGEVHERTLAELERCNLLESTLLPEKIAIKAKVTAKMPSLKAALDRYLPDPRVHHIVVDLKPTPDEAIVAATQLAVAEVGASGQEHASKLAFISRSKEALASLRALYPDANFALEGGTGMEAPFNGDDFFIEKGPGPKKYHNMVSLNLGLLSTFAQFPLPTFVMDRFVNKAHKKGYQVMAWTVSSKPGLWLTTRFMDEIDMLLTDAPFTRIARLQIGKHF